MCMMRATIGNPNNPATPVGTFFVKHDGVDLFIQAFKSNWQIPKGAEMPVTLQFDGDPPLTADAVGGTAGNGFVDFNVDSSFTVKFLARFALADTLTLSFPQGNERPWTLNMIGSSEAVASFAACVARLPKATQPYATQPSAPQATQPYRNDGTVQIPPGTLPQSKPVQLARPKGEDSI